MVAGLMCLAGLALVACLLFVVWPAPLCLTGGLLLIAVSIFGLRTVARSPVQAAGQAVGLIEQRHGAMMVLALLFAMSSVGVAAWIIFGGGQ